MTTSLTSEVARLAWGSLQLAIHDHLALRLPAEALAELVSLSEQAILCASAGHAECMLRVPPAMRQDGQEKLSVRGVVEALGLWPFLRPRTGGNGVEERPIEVYVDSRGNATTPGKAARLLSIWLNREGEVSRVEEWPPNEAPVEPSETESPGLPGPDPGAPPDAEGPPAAEGAA